MKEKILVTSENYKQVFNSLNYGINVIEYQNNDVRSNFNKMITVMNEFTGKWTVEEKKAVIDGVIDGEFSPIEVDNLYHVLYKNYHEPLPIIDNDNYEIENLAILAKEKSMLFNINNFESSLVKYAKSIANKHNVKFTGSGFNGAMKALSVRKQIEEAFLNGKHNIHFPAESFSVQTIRNHVSTYGSLIGRKFKVELSNGFIIVHFKDIEEANNLLISAKELFDKIGLKIGNEERASFFNKLLGNTFNDSGVVVGSINKEVVKTSRQIIMSADINDEKPIEIPKFVPRLYGKEVSLEEYKNAENWQRSGFASKYNWENDIKGDIDMYPKDARFDDSDYEEDQEPAKYNWDDDDEAKEEF